jgi:hypothetical protein
LPNVFFRIPVQGNEEISQLIEGPIQAVLARKKTLDITRVPKCTPGDEETGKK